MEKVKKSKKKNNFIIQGGVLALAGIIVRIIGLVKKVPVAGIIGDDGAAYYATAYGIYNLVLLISSYSLPLAVSKLVAARVSKGQYRNANRIYKGAMGFALVVGGISAILVFFFADFLAGSVMLEPMGTMALRVLSPTIFVVAVMGVLRGYFQGLGTMMPTAMSQIIEQIFVASTSIFGAWVLYGYGAKAGSLLQNQKLGASYGAAGATLGTTIGAVTGLLFLFFVFSAYFRKFKKQIHTDTSRSTESYMQIFRILFLTIVPVILSTAVYNISDVIDQRMFNKIMMDKGLEAVKTVSWGVYTIKYQTLLMVPIALANAMSASTMPSITGALARGDHRVLKDKIASVIRVTMVISIPCAVGLGVLATPVMDLLFRGEVALAAKLMNIGAISIVFFSLSTLGNGILQGINRMKIPVRNALISLALHVISLYVMLQYTNLQIYAVAISTIIFSLSMSVLNCLSIGRYLKYRQEMVRTFLIPAISAGIMGVVVKLLHMLFQKIMGTGLLSDLCSLAICVMLGAVVYFVLLILLKGIKERELAAMPAGHRLVAIAKKCKLL